MIFAHGFPLSTTDVDAIPKGIDVDQLGELSKKVALDFLDELLEEIE